MVNPQVKTPYAFPLWGLNRRQFLKSALAASIASSIPFWMSCSSNDEKEDNIEARSSKLIVRVQEFLFPNDGNGPSAYDINAHDYLLWVLKEKGMDPEDKEYIKDGLRWVEETAQEDFSNSFLSLSFQNQNTLLAAIVKTDWGASWMSVMLSLIFEALLSDPVYGSNTKGISWQWLTHNPGQPRPTEQQKFGNFIKHINKENNESGA